MTSNQNFASFSDGKAQSYINSQSVSDYLRMIESEHPKLYSTIDIDAVDEWSKRRSHDISTGFQSHGAGRGHFYRAQRAARPLSRPNVAELFRLLEAASPAKIVDLIGGNGHMAHVRELLKPLLGNTAPTIITSDLDSHQIVSALEQGRPAIRQPAQDTLFSNESYDAALFAYGTHHIPPSERQSAWDEAYRILRTGGRLVVQDFEEHSPTAKWYSEVLHTGTTTAHDFVHFDESTLAYQLHKSGFKNIEMHYIDDSFVIEGATEIDALITGIEHILTLFGVVNLFPDVPSESKWLKIIEDLKPYFELPAKHARFALAHKVKVKRQVSGGFQAIYPRVSLVATAWK